MALFGNPQVPPPVNERMRNYEPGSTDAALLKAACERLRSSPPLDVPCVVGGQEIHSGDVKKQVMPSDHKHVRKRKKKNSASNRHSHHSRTVFFSARQTLHSLTLTHSSCDSDVGSVHVPSGFEGNRSARHRLCAEGEREVGKHALCSSW